VSVGSTGAFNFTSFCGSAFSLHVEFGTGRTNKKASSEDIVIDWNIREESKIHRSAGDITL
jgi:hypothetical protein